MESFKRLSTHGNGNFYHTQLRQNTDSVVHQWDPIHQFRLENGYLLMVMGSVEVSSLYHQTATEKPEKPGIEIFVNINNLEFSLKGIRKFTNFQPQTTDCVAFYGYIEYPR